MRRDDLPVKKATINLFAGDLERLQELFPRPGASKIIRDMVHSYIKRVEADAQKGRKPTNIGIIADDLVD